MLGVPKPKTDSVGKLNDIQREVHKVLKPLGFTKHGRTEHRFVSEDISQVINLQLGQAYRGETHLLTVNTGIRVPECMEYLYEVIPEKMKYYQEYECNIRSELGSVEGRKASVYDLRKPIEPIIEDILRQLNETVLPAFEVLNSREAILEHRREYPTLDRMNDHLILREEAMIYRQWGDLENARTKYDAYLHNMIHGTPRRGVHLGNRQGWLSAALRIAGKMDIPISQEVLADAEAFLAQK